MSKEILASISDVSTDSEFFSPIPNGYAKGQTKFVFVLGTVMSGLGKGIFSSCLAKLMQDKNRNGDWEGTIKLWFDINTFQYRTFKDDKIKAFYEFSSIEDWKTRFPDAFK